MGRETGPTARARAKEAAAAPESPRQPSRTMATATLGQMPASLPAPSPSHSPLADSTDSTLGNPASAMNTEVDGSRRRPQSRWVWRLALALGFALGIACSAVAPLVTDRVSYVARALELLVEERVVEYSDNLITAAECFINATRPLERPLPHPGSRADGLQDYTRGVWHTYYPIYSLCHKAELFPSRPDIQQLCVEFSGNFTAFRRSPEPAPLYWGYQRRRETRYLGEIAHYLQQCVERQRADDGDTDNGDPGLPETPEARLLRRRHNGESAAQILGSVHAWRPQAAETRDALASRIHPLIVMENMAPYITDAFAYEIRGKRGAGLRDWERDEIQRRLDDCTAPENLQFLRTVIDHMETGEALYERGLALLDQVWDDVWPIYEAKEADALTHPLLLRLGWMPPAPILADAVYGAIALEDARLALDRRQDAEDEEDAARKGQVDTVEGQAGAMTKGAARRGRLCAVLDRVFSCSVEPRSQD